MLPVGPPPKRTLYVYDFETDDNDPRSCRPVQFAGQRTDLQLNPIGAPLHLLCRPQPDALPSVVATRIHGISPVTAAREGLSEVAFTGKILAELQVPGTVAVAYNGISFDHELMRFLCWRTLHDPYAWASRGNGRWDPLDWVRMVSALRPQALKWPRRDDGELSYRLEDLAKENGIAHGRAHDARFDVEATIGLLKLLRRRESKLLDFALGGLHWRDMIQRVNPDKPRPLLYSTSTVPAAHRCTTAVLPLDSLPGRHTTLTAWDLRVDPTPFLTMSAAQLHTATFTRAEDREEGELRPGIVQLKLNKCPAIAPFSVFNDGVGERIGLVRATVERHAAIIAENRAFGRIAAEATQRSWPAQTDPERALYEGFPSDQERDRLKALREGAPASLANERLFEGTAWADERLPELVFRFAARNFHHALPGRLRRRWWEHCRARLGEVGDDEQTVMQRWLAEVMEAEAAATDASTRQLLAELRGHGERIGQWLNLAGTQRQSGNRSGEES